MRQRNKKSGTIAGPTWRFYIYIFITYYFVIVIFFDIEWVAPLSSVTVRVTE